jgi:hypothetical protein
VCKGGWQAYDSAESQRGSIILVGSMCGEVCVRPQKQAAYNAVRSSLFSSFRFGTGKGR